MSIILPFYVDLLGLVKHFEIVETYTNFLISSL